MRAAGDLHAAIIASARSKVINKKMNNNPSPYFFFPPPKASIGVNPRAAWR